MSSLSGGCFLSCEGLTLTGGALSVSSIPLLTRHPFSICQPTSDLNALSSLEGLTCMYEWDELISITS
jgi:hypothetical protein